MADTILVSGFGPWGSIDENPTALVLDRLAAGDIADLVALPLPVDSAALSRLVDDALATHRPRLWLGLGLALGSATIAVERVAVNLRDFVEPDVVGAQPRGTPVVEGGPAAYLATLPVADMVARLRGAGIPARLSHSAGTFLCNELMYRVSHAVATRGLPTRVGFLHVPAHPALVARQHGRLAELPSMDLAMIAEAARLAMA